MRQFALLAAAALAASPAPLAAQSVFEACGPDLDTYCAAVVPGHGRLMACLYAHEDKLSESCDRAVGEIADVIDLMFERIRYVKQECGADIQANCADVAVGEGRVLRCLADRRDTLSESCLKVVDSVRLPEG